MSTSTVETVLIPSGDGACRGWLYRPSQAERPHGLVVMAHGFGGTHLTQYGRRAERLVDAGCAVLDFDPRGFGASPGRPRQRLRLSAWRTDLAAAIDYARNLDGVDPDRIGVFGSSLGGGLALDAAIRDPRIAAVDVVVPLVDGLYVTPGTPPTDRLRSFATIMRANLRRPFRSEPLTVPALGTRGSGALIVGDDDIAAFGAIFEGIDDLEWVEPGQWARHPELGEWRNDVLAADLLTLPFFRPGRQAARIAAPILAQLGTKDRVSPPGAQRRLLSRAPNVELHNHPIGHFDSFSGPWFEHTVSLDVAFFRRILATTE